MNNSSKNAESGAVAINITATEASAANKVLERSQRGHSKHLAVTIDLNQPGRLRVGHWLTLLAVSHSKFYELRRRGEIPPADGNDGRPFWNTSTARSVLNH